MENIFETKEDYLKFRKAWSDIYNSDERKVLELEHYVMYAFICNKDWNKCLSETTKRETLTRLYSFIGLNYISKFFEKMGISSSLIGIFANSIKKDIRR